MFEIENEKDLIHNIATEEFKSSRIRTFLPEEELVKHLKNIYRAAKVSIEEMEPIHYSLHWDFCVGLKVICPKNQDMLQLC